MCGSVMGFVLLISLLFSETVGAFCDDSVFSNDFWRLSGWILLYRCLDDARILCVLHGSRCL